MSLPLLQFFLPLRPQLEQASRLTALVGELTSKGMVKDLDGCGDVTPTQLTYPLVRTARPDLVVIRHVDIEYEFSPLRL